MQRVDVVEPSGPIDRESVKRATLSGNVTRYSCTRSKYQKM